MVDTASPALERSAASAAFAQPLTHASWTLADRSNFDLYVSGGQHTTVQGWVTEGALSAITMLSAAQRVLGCNGHVCEIGVHHGRYAIALSLLRRADEKTVAIDVFEDQALNVDQSGKGDFGIFTQNTDKWLGGQRLEIIKGDSLRVTPQQVMDRAGGPIRLFSVDGSHTTQHTLNDMRIAEQCVAPGGIVIVDDFFNPAWPGVPEAIFLYLNEPDHPRKLVPIGYGDNKFYLTTPERADPLMEVFKTAILPRTLRWKSVEVGGRQAAFFTLPPPATVCRAIDLRTGQDVAFGSEKEGLQGLGPGWYGPQKEGVWSHRLGGGLAFTLVAPPASGEVSLRLRVGLAVPDGSADPHAEVWANGRMVERSRFPAGTHSGAIDLRIDTRHLGSDGRLELWLRNPTPLFPKSSAPGTDQRTLGVFLATITRLT